MGLKSLAVHITEFIKKFKSEAFMSYHIKSQLTLSNSSLLSKYSCITALIFLISSTTRFSFSNQFFQASTLSIKYLHLSENVAFFS